MTTATTATGGVKLLPSHTGFKHIVSFSGGLGSAEALKQTVDAYGRENVIALFADVKGSGVIAPIHEQKTCLKCGESWPATSEFFPKNIAGNLVSPCKACWDEKRRATNRVKVCCYPGCTKPRYGDHYTRCYEHRYYAMKFYHPTELDEVKYYGRTDGTL